MNHPFNLSPEELAILDLSFNEAAVEAPEVQGGLSIATTQAFDEEGGHPLPIDPTPIPLPRPIPPKPRPINPHPCPPRHPSLHWKESGGPILYA